MKGISFIPDMAVAVMRDTSPKTVTRRIISPQPPAATEFFNLYLGGWQAKQKSPDVEGLTLHWGDFKCEYTVGERRCLLATWATLVDWDGWKPLDLLTENVANRFWHAGMNTPKPEWAGKSRPGRFLPNTLRHLMPVVEIVSIRAERLHDITEADAQAEGIERIVGSLLRWEKYRNYLHGDRGNECHNARASFATLWDSINRAPSPILVRGKNGKPNIVGYTAFPWSGDIFDLCYRGARKSGLYKGKPLVVAPNPWVWRVEFKRVKP